MELQPTAPPTQDERTLALLCQVSVFLSSFLAPLLIWLLKKDASDFVDRHGREALNFQVSLIVFVFAGVLLTPFLIGIPILFAALVGGVVFPIQAAVHARDGEHYRFPYSLRLL